MPATTLAHLCALGAIALWAVLAVLGVQLAHVPPFLLTGLALLIGSMPSWRQWREWNLVRWKVLLLGVYGLFGFHLLLFVAVRHAPPVEASLINYLWPLLVVVLAPALLPRLPLRPMHLVAALCGFAGAAAALLGGAGQAQHDSSGDALGYSAAVGSALIWATYSLVTRRLADLCKPYPTSMVGLFGLVSGVLSLACHLAFEPEVTLGLHDVSLIAAVGLGPMGAAFYLWDRALKLGDPRIISVISYVTPLASTVLLILVNGRGFDGGVLLSTVLVSGAAMLVLRTR
ncbi:MAG TPA: DMT family transporter [Burkholderiaceae bacterium]|jgi:drug/metabolite transporter (DMT)-like permease|nr:DMT family transporter [Burkholderiaceae bacterium]